MKNIGNNKFIKRKSWVRVSFLLVLGVMLTGCESLSDSYSEFIDEQASPSSTEESVLTENSSQTVEEESSGLIDSRLVPELAMVENALLENDLYDVKEGLYETSTNFTQKQATFEVSVDQLNVYAIEEWDESLDHQFDAESGEAGIVLLNMTITNTSKETFYFPIDELRLSHLDAPFQNFPSHDLYPLESGNLAQILLENQGELGAQSAVEGYLVFGVSGEALDEIMDLGSFYLTVVPPRQSLDQIIGLDSTILGEELPMFLPVKDEIETQLSLNAANIQDRLTTEWWGEKTILATEQLNQQQEDSGLTVTLKRAELSDFKPNDTYEEAFQNFIHGQLIVSLEYEVQNNSEHPILPIDGPGSLVINGDEITSEYLLINELYGKVLEPGQTYTMVKTFALDKMRYYDMWQNEEISISLSLPIATKDDSDAAEEQEQEQDMKDENSEETDEFYFQFNWLPTLQLFVDESMELVDELPQDNLEEPFSDEEGALEEESE